jgi:hypothetical protein
MESERSILGWRRRKGGGGGGGGGCWAVVAADLASVRLGTAVYKDLTRVLLLV